MVEICNNKKIKAFTMAEVMMAMLIIGVIISMTISNAVKQAPDMAKAKFKKAYTTIENNISRMINNEDLYIGSLAYDRRVETEFGDVFEGESKFRTAFFYYLDILSSDQEGVDDLKLQHFAVDTFATSSKGECARSKDGVIYCIPDTNFKNNGTFEVETKKTITVDGKSEESTTIHKYVPITVYPNVAPDEIEEKGQNPQMHATVVAVREDGQILLPDPDAVPFNLGCTSNPEAIMCNAASYLADDTLRKKARVYSEESVAPPAAPAPVVGSTGGLVVDPSEVVTPEIISPPTVEDIPTPPAMSAQQ